RDRLMEYLRLRLEPLSLWIEPEGHMAVDKRADMVVFGPNRLKLPVEVKRDSHADLWSAPKSQLERLYAKDPGARGYGVYLVFYFGTQRGARMTAHPDGIAIPDSAQDLLSALAASIPIEHRERLSSVVIDVSPPAASRAKMSKAKVSRKAFERAA